VKSQLSKAFEPALTSVKVMWQQFDENAPKPIQVCFSFFFVHVFMHAGRMCMSKWLLGPL